MKEVWLKYQQVTGNSLDTIINERFKDKDYIIWLEDELGKHYKLKGILYNVGSDDLTVDQAIKLINKIHETTTIGSVDSPFNEHNLFNPDNPQGLG